ncbi:MAG TPA: chalcone isomerase family protein [Steroidobacteraceae bacterium]|nr:chalcone isomerase family protein [Steroidobacteraceae bacterium]
MKQWLAAAALVMALYGSATAATVDGIRVADTAEVGGTPLVLNGAGMRTWFLFHVYVGALYLRSHTTDAAQALAYPGPKRVSMTLARALGAGELIDALREGIARNATPAELTRIAPQLASLIATMRAIGGVQQGDLLTIDFLADGTTRLTRNGRPQGAPIAGRNFQRDLLAVWIGPNPVQADLKRALLGRGD